MQREAKHEPSQPLGGTPSPQRGPSGEREHIVLAASSGGTPNQIDSMETVISAASVPDAAGIAARALARINRLVVIVSSVALVIASFVLTYSVIVRYFLHFPTDWQDEMSVFLIVGAVFMSAASIQAKRGHVAIEAIVGLLPERTNSLRILLVDA